MLFLQYGVNENQELIRIDQVARGQTALHCPYCGGLLVARKGERLAHHFAHRGETCRSAARDFTSLSLPVYDQFNLNLPGKAVVQLRAWNARTSGEPIDEQVKVHESYLAEQEVLSWNEYKGRYRSGGYDLTKKGKLVLGKLSLDLFNQFQEPLIVERHTRLENKALRARGTVDFETYLTDLRLYRAQMQRLLACTLYFLKIEAAELTDLYKIGVTARPIAQRVAEIRAELEALLGETTITVIDTRAARGNVEHYFKYRYKAQQHPLANGRLTEYFQFSDIKSVLGDLRRMKDKELSPLEHDILTGAPTDLERLIQAEQIEVKRRAAIRSGLQHAAERGHPIGRPKGRLTPTQVLAQPYATAVIQALQAGYPLRDAASVSGVALNTVRKVEAALTATGQPVNKQKPMKLTRTDLPDTADPQVLFDFCAEYAGPLRWRTWEDGICEQEQDAFFLHGYANEHNHYQSQNLYLGHTLDEVIAVFLIWANRGKDIPLKRLCLTEAEQVLLLKLDQQQIDSQRPSPSQMPVLTEEELQQANSLLHKYLITNSRVRNPKFYLTQDGKTAALLIGQRESMKQVS